MEQLQDFTARSAVRAGDQDHFSSTPAKRAPIRPEWRRGYYSATNVLRAPEHCPVSTVGYVLGSSADMSTIGRTQT